MDAPQRTISVFWMRRRTWVRILSLGGMPACQNASLQVNLVEVSRLSLLLITRQKLFIAFFLIGLLRLSLRLISKFSWETDLQLKTAHILAQDEVHPLYDYCGVAIRVFASSR